jgi:hypothetical protein
MPNYHYAYLVGAGIFWIAWIICFIVGKPYRPHIRWGTLIAAPMALTSILFVPQYWTPESLLSLDKKIRVGIEDFLWAAAVGGIAAVLGEVIVKDKLAALRSSRHQRHYAPFIFVAALFVVLEFVRNNTMDNTIISFAAGALVLAYLRPNLLPLMVTSTVNFSILYFVLFLAVLALYPEFVTRFYNRPKLLGIYLAGVPIEELLFAATGGAIWSVAYEYVHGYRLEAAGVI